MIKEIKVFNRMSMDFFASNIGTNFPYEYWYLISIYDDTPLINTKSLDILNRIGCKAAISLKFTDITLDAFTEAKKKYPDDKNINKMIIFNEEHAKKIVNFIDLVKKDPLDIALVLHCAAGISRSGAAATFACDYCNFDYAKFIETNPLLFPNRYVLDTLHKVAGTKQVKGHDGIDHKYDGSFV